jgi:glutaminyl-tRNA synthetase
MEEEVKESLNFLEELVKADIEAGKHEGRVLTRFPPEPNGYLHIGHAKAIWVSFSIAQKYGGKTNLRFDDTNPTTEDTEYVESIKRDIKWLGYEWEGDPLFTSDYFQQLYDFAVKLIKNGDAYVDDSTSEEMAAQKGTPTEPGKNSTYRSRSIEENLELFTGMKNGEYPDGSRVLRAKIDMASPNMLLRDPIIYRIKKETHHRTGDDWCIYPMYDFAHGQSDSIEGITHSLCSLEFMHHRPLYDWCIEKLEIFPSKQTEFARMNVEYMITSKRRLLKLVEQNYVSGWDDPRMPTLSGMRRRGIPPAAIRQFCEVTGITKRENLQELSLFNSCVRDELNKTAHRVMVVLNPIKLVITNYPEGQSEMLIGENNQSDETAGTREIPFGRELYIERDDFMEDAPKKFFRLGIGKNVRLKHAFIITGDSVEKDAEGNITQINCTYYPESKSGSDNSGIKAKGTLHWVSIKDAVDINLRNYDNLFTDPAPMGHEGKDYLEFYNEESLTLATAKAEPALKTAEVGKTLQFIRKGYYTLDQDSTDDNLIFNKTIAMKDSWAKKQNKNKS